jgi:cytochrome c oxidase assembly protein subunit 15
MMLATHFGVSLVAFASTYLSAVLVFERTSPRRVRRPAGVPGAFRNLAGLVGVYVLGVVYLGAYVQHAGVSMACFDWPLCNGQFVPPLDGHTGIVFAHRLAALGAVILLWLLMIKARAVGVARSASIHAFGLGILQAFSGAIVVWTHMGLFSTLLHAAIMGLLFATLSSVVWLTLREPRPEQRARAENIHRGLHQPEGYADSRLLGVVDPAHHESQHV